MGKRVKTYKELAIEFKNTRSERVFNELYKKIKPGLWNYIFKILKDVDMANDIVSTTLTKIYYNIDSYNEDYQITTWAYKIAFNDSIQYLNSKKRVISSEVFTEKGVDSIFEPHIDVFNCEPVQLDALTEQDMIFEEKYNSVLNAINELPDMYKNYLTASLFDKKAYNEILEMMVEKEDNVSLSTVKNRICRGKKLVRNKLEKLEIFSKN